MISNISFGNAASYVHDGTVFAEKEIKEAAKRVAKAIEQDNALRLIMGDADKYGSKEFARYDAPIIRQAEDTSRELSYGISHGNPQIEEKTIAIV